MSNLHKHDLAYVRLDFLDSLRAFAAFYVIIYHLALIPDPHLAVPTWMSFYASNGGTGVSLFFVLSAFALSYSLDARRSEPGLFLHFYIRRLFRIAPLFYLMLVFYFIRDIIFFDRIHSGKEVLLNASMLFNFWPDHLKGYVWASWTIGVEMLFYVLFPLIHRYVRNLTQAISLLLVSILASQAWSFFIDHYGILAGYVTEEQIAAVKHHGFLTNLPAFSCGLVAYHVFFDHLIKLGEVQRRQLGLLFVILFLFLYTALLSNYLSHILWGGLVWQGVCYSLLILGLGLRPLPLLVNAMTVRLGKVSYSLYLIHPTLVFALAPIYYWMYAVLPNKTAAFGASFLITAGLVSTLSAFTYQRIERVGIAWGETVIDRWTGKNRHHA